MQTRQNEFEEKLTNLRGEVRSGMGEMRSEVKALEMNSGSIKTR